MEKPIAILTSDIHLSDMAPRARSAEPDWFAAMGRSLNLLRGAAARYDCPVIIAGDIFHRWNPSPRLINFAMQQFSKIPLVYAVPGQHDLRYHKLSDIEHTGFWTLHAAGAINYLAPGRPAPLAANWRMYGVPWGCEPQQQEFSGKKLAVIHEYCWEKGKGYPGAEDEALWTNLSKKYAGFDVCHFGDNHIPFDGPGVFNGGAFIRRNQPEKDFSLSWGLLFPDGTIEREYGDDEALWSDAVQAPGELLDAIGEDMHKFLDAMQQQEMEEVDFCRTIREAAKKAKPRVAKMLLEAIDGLS